MSNEITKHPDNSVASMELLGVDHPFDAQEFARLKEREHKCPTMLEAEARALVRALQEIRDELRMMECASPRQIVDEVRRRLKPNDSGETEETRRKL